MIELLVFDVDGCLTNGQITYTQKGDEVKSFDVKDGLAISSWIRMGKKAAIITGRKSKIVERRAKELGIKYLFQGVKDKLTSMEDLRRKLNLEHEQIAAIGDDLNDYRMLEAVGKSYMPANGSRHIKEVCDTVLQNRGGDGAVREMIEDIIATDGLEEEFLKIWK